MKNWAKLMEQIPKKNVSKYSLRMLKLRSKIFNEYIRPPMPFEISRAAMRDPRQRQSWDSIQYQNERLVMRFASLPLDLDYRRSMRYYPAHPQIGDLMTVLRQHGLYRNEHKDIKEEMSRLRELREKSNSNRDELDE
ncbi:X-linked retinitis pigmentosa GTPase regulator-like protein [Sarcoptes scabiei]|nr:X-linked retinitis pigmentosa GTPase regulator-like protein [Sarcoptes scabiei]